MLILVLSEPAIASFWVENEVGAAFERERVRRSHSNEKQVLFPITIDNSIFASKKAWAELIRTTRDIGDFRNWQDPALYRVALENLVKELKNGMYKDFEYGEINNYLQR